MGPVAVAASRWWLSRCRVIAAVLRAHGAAAAVLLVVGAKFISSTGGIGFGRLGRSRANKRECAVEARSSLLPLAFLLFRPCRV